MADAVWAGCCAIEMIATTMAVRSGAVRRGGVQAVAAAADLMIISGR